MVMLVQMKMSTTFGWMIERERVGEGGGERREVLALEHNDN